jgi:hypothetical protein
MSECIENGGQSLCSTFHVKHIANCVYATATIEKSRLIPQVLNNASSSVVPNFDGGCNFVSLVQFIELTLDVPKILTTWDVSDSAEFSLNSYLVPGWIIG